MKADSFPQVRAGCTGSNLEPSDRLWKPVILRLREPGEAQALEDLRSQGIIRVVHDSLKAQLEDLARIRHPQSKLAREEMANAVQALLGGVEPGQYGCWVFFPWSGHLVHLLDAAEFSEVRFNRNRNK